MRTLGLSPVNRLAEFAPLVVRVIVGVIMVAHGWQKITQIGVGNFGATHLVCGPRPSSTCARFMS